MGNLTYSIDIKANGAFTKVEQIVNRMMHDIDKGVLASEAPLPSALEFSRANNVGILTVEKAYFKLKKNGYIVAVPGKGCFVRQSRKQLTSLLIVLDKMSPTRIRICDALTSRLGEGFKVDIQVHHGKQALFSEIISSNRSKYQYYAIVPNFNKDTENAYLDVLKSIPASKLVLLDRELDVHKNEICIYRDQQMDVFQAFTEKASLFEKYSSLSVVYPAGNEYTTGLLDGLKQFCAQQHLIFKVIGKIDDSRPKVGDVYIVLTEPDLGSAISAIRKEKLSLGKHVGIVSLNHSLLEELMDITAFSTDLVSMGTMAAEMLLSGNKSKLRNKYLFVSRGSL